MITQSDRRINGPVVVFALAGTSLAAIAVFFLSAAIGALGVGRWAGGVGVMSSLNAVGVGLWIAVRNRKRTSVLAFVLSVPLFAFWSWVVYQAVSGGS